MRIDPIWKLQLEKLADNFMNLIPVQVHNLDRYAFPKKGGVYAFSNISQDECIYVGKTIDFRNRVFDTHLNGIKGKSNLRAALLGLKKSRKTPLSLP
ncbi:GIY-YIG nuclease family protein [Paenibacillus alvei]|uniref:GIY-YIG nuclease family protein n=1 Tax=Paenibacillus alvei TaxID=44250 RepID=A0ABT4H2I5_PAEAL|nr:GIY-YIG nuclease family protein [Paenibacillus alvei]MCY9763192.1 GIY-YIG nuclease family protein [Paenibacillus alvei]MCY9769519.1 GIY-YIG nuclease family protein [Paenibacillus alvei]